MLTVPWCIWLAPWANRQIAEYQQRFEQRQDVSKVSAGQFRESASASRVFFVESISEDERSVRNVFVTQQRGENLSIVVSAGGQITGEPDGERFLVLEKGRRYDGRTAAAEFARVEGSGSVSTQKARETLARLLIARKDFAGSEAVLLESHRGVTAGKKTPATHAERSSIKPIIALYETWDAAEPGKGYDAKVAEWKAKLPAAEPAKAESAKEPSDKK